MAALIQVHIEMDEGEKFIPRHVPDRMLKNALVKVDIGEEGELLLHGFKAARVKNLCRPVHSDFPPQRERVGIGKLIFKFLALFLAQDCIVD